MRLLKRWLRKKTKEPVEPDGAYYWIQYTDGGRSLFWAIDEQAALEYFAMEGRHAHDYGPIIEGNKKPRTGRGS